MIKLTDIIFEGKLSKSEIKKMRDKFDKTGKLPPHLQKLADLMKKNTKVKDVVVPGLEWMAEEITSGAIQMGGSDVGREIVSIMTGGGKGYMLDKLSNMDNTFAQYKDSVEFGLKKKIKIGKEIVSRVQIKKTGRDKYTVAYLDWNERGSRPLITRKLVKNVSGKNLPKELKKSVKVG